MYAFINSAVTVQVILLSSGVVCLLVALYVQRTGGIRRRAARRGLEEALREYESGSESLPESVLMTAQGRLILLDKLLQESGQQSRDRITQLGLEDMMRTGLLHRKSRISAMIQMRRAGLAGTAQALERYWGSKDPDECYFSIYCSIPHLQDAEQKERISRAVMAASFHSDRKKEMLQALGLSNQFLQDQAEQRDGAGRADMIRSLNGADLTGAEFDRLLSMLAKDPGMRYAAIPCLIASSLQEAFSYLRQTALHDTDPVLREAIASQLSGQPGTAACRLLSAMMEDPVRAVRESAAKSMMAHAEEGKAYLERAVTQGSLRRQALARRHLTLGGT